MRPGRFAELCALDNAVRRGGGEVVLSVSRPRSLDGPVSAVVDLLADKPTRGVTLTP